LEGVHSWLVGNRAVLTDDTLAECLQSWFSEDVRRYFPDFADQLLEVISGTHDIGLVARTSTFQDCTPRRAVGATQSRRVQSVYGEDGYLVQRPPNANNVSRDMADQLTLVFHRSYLALPRASQLVADWMIGGRERKFASPEVALIDLSDDLTKLVAASLRLVARDSRLLEGIAARWLDVEKVRLPFVAAGTRCNLTLLSIGVLRARQLRSCLRDSPSPRLRSLSAHRHDCRSESSWGSWPCWFSLRCSGGTYPEAVHFADMDLWPVPSRDSRR
jgi:hypothetical protein